MLELKLFDELEPPLQLAAATVLAGPKGDSVDALGYLLHGNIVPVTGVDSGKLVAAYGLPFFAREGNFLRNSGFGFMATEPRGKGIGTSLLVSLERIFEDVSYEAHAVLIHREASDSSIFLRCGYNPDGSFNDKVRVISRRYEPKKHLLKEPERRIVDKLLHSVQVPTF